MAHADTDEAAGACVAAPPRPIASPPTPIPPGGPAARASGPPAGSFAATAAPSLPTAAAPALLLEPDPLLRPVAENAVRQLGFEPGSSLRPFSS